MIYEAVINEENQDSFLGEIIGGVVSGVLAIIALILLILFLKQRSKQENSAISSTTEAVKNDIEAEKIPLESQEIKEEQKMALLPPPPEIDQDLDSDTDSIRPKFASPIWLDEIHNNKIFNRQKSLLSEDKLKELAENDLPPPPPLPEEAEPLVNGDSKHEDASDDNTDIA